MLLEHLDYAKCLIEPLLEDGGDATLAFLKKLLERYLACFNSWSPTTFLIVDSTPLVDLYDMEAGWGHTSRGKFRGFKLHSAVNQLGLPLRAVVTPGNRYDSPFLPRLIEDLEADYVLADAGYDSKTNKEP